MALCKTELTKEKKSQECPGQHQVCTNGIPGVDLDIYA